MGNSCNAKKHHSDISPTQKSTLKQNETTQIEIDEIPKDLITRTLKKVDSEIPEENNNAEEKTAVKFLKNSLSTIYFLKN